MNFESLLRNSIQWKQSDILVILGKISVCLGVGKMKNWYLELLYNILLIDTFELEKTQIFKKINQCKTNKSTTTTIKK